ncbi:hypothetical protein EYV94_27565 [Puteibacter caeruleilacunae]|nr:hypothetical protein EYV94_27565 [Puteibacter caeruleilacunae]
MKVYYIFISIVILVGCHNQSKIVPFHEIEYINSYHCFPYKVEVYRIAEIEVTEQLYNYPISGFCKRSEYNLVTWTKFSKYRDPAKESLIATIGRCKENKELIKQINNESDIFFAGCYRYMLNNKNEKERSYNKLAFLSKESRTLYVFKDLQ